MSGPVGDEPEASDSENDMFEDWTLEEHTKAVAMLRREFDQLKRKQLKDTEDAIMERIRDVNNGMDPDFKTTLKQLEQTNQSKRELNDTRKRLRDANIAAWYAGEQQLAEQTIVENKLLLQQRLVKKLERRRSVAIVAHKNRDKPLIVPGFENMEGSRNLLHLLKAMPSDDGAGSFLEDEDDSEDEEDDEGEEDGMLPYPPARHGDKKRDRRHQYEAHEAHGGRHHGGALESLPPPHKPQKRKIVTNVVPLIYELHVQEINEDLALFRH